MASNKFQKGGIEIIILGIIIVASFALIGGFSPLVKNPPIDTTIYTPDAEILRGSQNNLQLKTIKFTSCGSSAAIGFLVDQSGSMGFGTPGATKEDNLKNALNVFATNFPTEGIAGLNTFSDHEPPDIHPSVPFNFFKNNKSQFINVVTNMTSNGGTYTKDAFILEKQILDAARAKYPDYKFNLIFISDGVPETRAGNYACPGGPGPSSRYCTAIPSNSPPACRCFDTSQDPTSIASQIKSSGVRIFTIGYVRDEDAKFQDDLTNLMKNIASSPTDFFVAPIDNQITSILQQISVKICK